MDRSVIVAVIVFGLVALCGLLNSKPNETAAVVTHTWTPVEPAPTMPEGTHCWQLTTNLTKSNPHFYLTCDYPTPAAPAPVNPETTTP